MEPQTSFADHIVNGMTVYSADNEKLGTVRAYDPQVSYLDVEKGFLFTKDVYVPRMAIRSIVGGAIMLTLTKAEVEDDRYRTPPAPTEVVYGETFVTEAAIPKNAELGSDVEEDATTPRTAQGRPSR